MEYIRRAEFVPYFLGLERPNNSLTITVHGQSPAAARNEIAQAALDNKCTHILFVDDDMCYHPSSLMRLMQHDVDIVTGLYLTRSFPHRPAIFDKWYPNGKCKYSVMDKNFAKENSVIDCVNAGLGFVLISTEVFKVLEKPWVRLGELEKDGWCDDIGFFNRCREAKFKMICDTEVCIGHMTNVTIWPVKVDGVWKTEYRHTTGSIQFEQHIPEDKDIKEQELVLGVL